MSSILDRIEAKLDRVLRHLRALQTETDIMAADLSAIQTAVQQNGDVEQSAITLLNGLSAQLKSIANDPAAVQALADQLTQQSGTLAAAVVANTPAAPTPAPPPGPTPVSAAKKKP